MTFNQHIQKEVEMPDQYSILDLLLQNLSAQSRKNKKIAISTMEGFSFYEVDEIMHFEACSNYTIIYFKDHPKLTVSKTLKDFEEMLPEDTFLRVHHSHIININYLKRYIKGDGGQIELINGRTIDVSRRKKEEFMQAIHAFSSPTNFDVLKDKLNTELLKLMLQKISY
jgi:two-component system, LytTR family, response regulator